MLRSTVTSSRRSSFSGPNAGAPSNSSPSGDGATTACPRHCTENRLASSSILMVAWLCGEVMASGLAMADPAATAQAIAAITASVLWCKFISYSDQSVAANLEGHRDSAGQPFWHAHLQALAAALEGQRVGGT